MDILDTLEGHYSLSTSLDIQGVYMYMYSSKHSGLENKKKNQQQQQQQQNNNNNNNLEFCK